MSKTKLVAKKATKTKLKAKRNVTFVSLAIDSSGSMDWLTDEVQAYYKQFIKDWEAQAKENNLEVYLAVYTFAYNVECLTKNRITGETHIPLHLVGDLDYNPDGGTALIAAIGEATEQLPAAPTDANTAFLVVILSDGLNNQYGKWSATRLEQLIKNRTEAGNYTLAVQVPDTGRHAALSCGVPTDNVGCWKIDKQGRKQNT